METQTIRLMNTTRHFLIRWVERIVGITDEVARNAYITENAEQIKSHASETFAYSTFLWKGQLGNNVTRHYYIKDDLVILTNTTDDALITVFKIDFSFPGDINSYVRKGLIKEIERLHIEKEKAETLILEEMSLKEEALAKVKEEIRILEEQLKAQKEREKFLITDISTMEKSSKVIDLEIKKNTNLLINSKEYREDLSMI